MAVLPNSAPDSFTPKNWNLVVALGQIVLLPDGNVVVVVGEVDVGVGADVHGVAVRALPAPAIAALQRLRECPRCSAAPGSGRTDEQPRMGHRGPRAAAVDDLRSPGTRCSW